MMSAMNVMGVWSFGSVWMLLWAFSASIPILLHLWSRRRYQHETWAAMEFLLAALKKHARRIRIEQLILLIIRTLVLVMLAAALADPILSAVGLSLPFGGGRTHRVVVVDGSYSMDYDAANSETNDQRSTRFERARKLAQQLVQQCRQGDGFTLVLMSDPPRVIVERPAFDIQDVVDEISGLEVGHRGANLEATLIEVEKIVEHARGLRRLQDHRVCFFSDLGTTTWEAASNDATLERINRLAKLSDLFLYDVGEGGRENLAITDLELANNSLPLAGQELILKATIRNFGSVDQRDKRLELRVDGKREKQRTITVPAGEPYSVPFPVRLESAGEHQVSVHLLSNPLSIDNSRYLSLPVAEAIDVLCVEGQPNAAKQLLAALQPRDGDSGIRTVARSESVLIEDALDEYDCIFLCNVARIGKEEASVLRDFVQRGGGLVVCLGDQVQVDNYNQYLGTGAGADALLPATLEKVAESAQHGLNPMGYKHPIVESFRGFEKAGLLTTPVWRYIRATPRDDSNVRVALGYQTGDPAVVEWPVKQGRCVLLTTSVSVLSVDRRVEPVVPWSALATWPSFPPLMQELVRLLVQDLQAVRNLSAGDEIVAAMPPHQEGPVFVKPPGETTRLNAQIFREGNSARWSFADTWRSGVYAASVGDTDQSMELFALNVDTAESEMSTLDDALLPDVIQKAEVTADQDLEISTQLGQTPYFRYLLLVVAGLLLLESWLAHYFGRSRGRSR